jgi:Tfp pilus assembly PilM family ATPase
MLNGDGSLLPGLGDFVSKYLGVRAVVANPWAGINIDERFKDIVTKGGPSFSVAIGLALKDE